MCNIMSSVLLLLEMIVQGGLIEAESLGCLALSFLLD